VRTIRNTQIQSVPHRKLIVSITEPNRLILFGETVAVYCENDTEHRQSVPHRKLIVSFTEPKRLMLFGETVAVYCENHTEHTHTHTHTVRTSLETHCLRYRDQPVSSVYCENHTEHRYSVWGECRVLVLKLAVRIAGFKGEHNYYTCIVSLDHESCCR
jgi:hypothetical protein